MSRPFTWCTPALAVALATACASSDPQTQSGGEFVDGAQSYWIGGGAARRCLQTGTSNAVPGTPLQLGSCAATADQRFAFAPVGGHHVVAHWASGLCLRVESGKTTAGAAVVLDTCSDAADEQFTVLRNGDCVRLQARHSGLFLEAAQRTVSGADVVQGTSGGGADQLFGLKTWSTGAFSGWSGTCGGTSSGSSGTSGSSSSGTSGSSGGGTSGSSSSGTSGSSSSGASGSSSSGTSGSSSSGTSGSSGGSTSGSSSGGTSGSSGGSTSGSSSGGGGGTCAWPEPPANVSAWIDESWNAQLKPNITGRRAWLLDAVMKGNGSINLCIRWSGTARFTTAWRDRIESSMRSWFNGWFKHLAGYGCFPYPDGVTVKIAGIAVKPGQESLLEWTDRTIPVYTQTDPNTDPPGEPKCPDACSFFANWGHRFPSCPGGEANHFDYDVWLGDTLPGGAGAVGGDWGVRMPRATFTNALGSADFFIGQHEMGHGFGMQDYYDWTGSKPAGGSVMIVGSAWGAPTTADGWLLRRVWKEQQALRGW